MQTQQRPTWRSQAALAVLTSCALGIFAGAGTEQEVGKPLPPKFAKAWRDAGVRIGWMRISKDFEYVFEEVRFIHDDNPPVGELPAFQYGEPSQVPLAKQPRWKAGVLGKLPDPGVPFALEMWGQPLKDAGLKELANLKSMQML